MHNESTTLSCLRLGAILWVRQNHHRAAIGNSLNDIPQDFLWLQETARDIATQSSNPAEVTTASLSLQS